MDVQSATGEYRQATLHLSHSTRRRRTQQLALFAEWCASHDLPLEHLKIAHVRAFIEEVRKRPGMKPGPLKAATVKEYTVSIKAFLHWCMQEEEFEGIVPPKLASRVMLPKVEQTVIETFTPQQIEALFAAAETQPFPVRDKALLAVLVDTGARASEVAGLTLGCVWLDADDSYIKVTGKGRKEREIALGRFARIALRRYITRYRKPRHKSEQRVFLGYSGRPLTASGLGQIIASLGEKAHIKGVRCSPHTFRHTFASEYLLNGGDVYKLSRLMGHTSVKVTERYLGAVKAKQARAGGQSVLDHLKDHL